MNTASTLDSIKKHIADSPLHYIKGQCRLLNLTPEEWIEWNNEDDFFDPQMPHHRIISFALGNILVGELVIEKEHISSCKIDDANNFDMVLDIRANGLMTIMHIHCSNDFPGLLEFAEFVAYDEPDPNLNK